MRSLEAMDDMLAILSRGRASRVREIPVAEPFDYECQVEAELFTNLVLDGWINCRLEIQDGEVWISRQKLKVKDKDGRDIEIDWDELQSRTQSKIEDQVVRAYHGERMGT